MRVRRRLRGWSAKARYRLGIPRAAPSAARLAEGFRHPIDAALQPALVEQYRSRFPGAAHAEVLEAQRLAAHQFSILGYPAQYGNQIGWSIDPLSGREWSRGFSPDIPYRGASRLGDIKFPWELAKQQYFFTLGKAGWLEENPGSAIEIINQINHWIEDNPYLRGVHWISALEVGSRIISWIVAYPFYAPHCSPAFKQRLASSLAQQLIFVEQHLSVGPYANTHLAGEAAALLIGGYFLDCPGSARWRSTGLELLEAQLAAQVTPDGVHAERSLPYHRFFLDHYYLVAILLAANGRPLREATLRRIESMTEALMYLLFPGGSPPAFGDGDDARGLWLCMDASADYRGLLALGAVLFGRGDFKSVCGDVREEVLWLLGTRGLDTFNRLQPRAPSQTSVGYPEAGYYAMRGGWNAADPMLVADCGPLGFGTAAHGHADALSFQLHAGGYPFLVDSGTFSYNIDYGWRDSFRSTRAHNTVVVDGQEQSEPGDRLSWKSVAVARAHAWITSPWFDVLDGEHDGYARLPDPVAHRRAILFLKPDVWIVWDHVDARDQHTIDTLFHLRPDCEIVHGADAKTLHLLSPAGQRLDVSFGPLDDEGTCVEIVSGNDSERMAWFSGKYGHRCPSKAIRATRAFTGHHSVITSISAREGLRPSVTIQENMVGVRLDRGNGWEDRIVYVAPLVDGKRVPVTENVTFDGSVFFERRILGRTTTARADRFRYLSIANLLEVSSPRLIDSVTLQNDCCELLTASDAAQGVVVNAQPGVRVFVNGQPVAT